MVFGYPNISQCVRITDFLDWIHPIGSHLECMQSRQQVLHSALNRSPLFTQCWCC